MVNRKMIYARNTVDPCPFRLFGGDNGHPVSLSRRPCGYRKAINHRVSFLFYLILYIRSTKMISIIKNFALLFVLFIVLAFSFAYIINGRHDGDDLGNKASSTKTEIIKDDNNKAIAPTLSEDKNNDYNRTIKYTENQNLHKEECMNFDYKQCVANCSGMFCGECEAMQEICRVRNEIIRDDLQNAIDIKNDLQYERFDY